MATLLLSLQAVNAYPIPQSFIISAAVARGLDPGQEVTQDALSSRSYRLVYADLLMWLSTAPNIAQGGQNYSFNDDQRKLFRAQAAAIYNELDDSSVHRVCYGYKGSSL